ncbi:MAG: hypothetical protein Q9187_005101 [Circinaria calcarea]
MSFGVGVGDIIAVSTLANKVRKRFVDSPDQFKRISEEVKSLSNVLRDLEDVLPERELTDRQKTHLHDITQGYHSVLVDSDKIVEKYWSLDVNHRSLSGKSQRLWKRLKWEPDDVAELRSRISSNINLLNAFNGGIAINLSQVTKDSVDRLHRHHDDHERRLIESWLSSADFAAQQSDFIGRRQEGTGQWLLDSQEFETWVSGTKQTLFCQGMPGAGKTIIASIVIDDLWSKFQAESDVAIAFLFCNYKRQQEQKFEHLMSSLLAQLVKGRSNLPESIRNLHQRHVDRGTRPSIEEIITLFHSVSRSYSKIFIVVDALDECSKIDNTRKRLLEELFTLQSHTKAGFFATSRENPEIATLFQGAILKEIRASDEDVRRYLASRIAELPKCVLRDQALQDNIQTEIAKAVDGMFLLAQLHLDSLADKITPKAIKLALQKLPKGSEALKIAYGEALERIDGQKPGFKTLAKQVLSWITYAERQLTISELQHALAVEIGENELDEANLPESDDMISACAGLVTVDQESNVIRLVHYTAQEYFERIRLSWAPDAQTEITRTCLTYLSFNAFGPGPCKNDEDFEARLQQNVLLEYAAKYFGWHARAASNEVTKQLVLNFLDGNLKLDYLNQVIMTSKPAYTGYSQHWQTQITAMHLAAYFGLKEVIIELLKGGHLPDPKDSDDGTPLSWAVKYGREAVVKLLVGRDDVEVNSEDKYGRTLLSQASENGNETIIRFLLSKGGDINAEGAYYGNALQTAAAKGHETTVRFLLSEGADINAQGGFYSNALQAAAAGGHEIIVQLLLSEGADINAQGGVYSTALQHAVAMGHETIIRLLLSEGADINAQGGFYSNALQVATAGGHETTIPLLLSEGADINAQGGYFGNALQAAAVGGNESIVRFLLSEGADINAQGGDYGNALQAAAARGHETIIRFLLSEGADINAQGGYSGNALQAAAARGYETVTRLLLSEGADINVQGGRYGNALQAAAARGHENIIRLLLSEGAYIDVQGGGYGDALEEAKSEGHDAMVQFLLEKAAEDPKGTLPTTSCERQEGLAIPYRTP